MVTEVHHPVAGEVKTIGTPVKFNHTPVGINRAAPVFGQHTVEILHEAGYNDNEIQKLAADGVVSITDIKSQ